MEKKKCSKCNRKKLLTEFNWRNKKKKVRASACKDCTREEVKAHYSANTEYYLEKASRTAKKRRKENRQKILEYFTEHPCVDCGENDPRCLTFDHVRDKKEMMISTMIRDRHWQAIEKEIRKCDVRCANCHAKKTATDFKYYTAL